MPSVTGHTRANVAVNQICTCGAIFTGLRITVVGVDASAIVVIETRSTGAGKVTTDLREWRTGRAAGLAWIASIKDDRTIREYVILICRAL